MFCPKKGAIPAKSAETGEPHSSGNGISHQKKPAIPPRMPPDLILFVLSAFLTGQSAKGLWPSRALHRILIRLIPPRSRAHAHADLVGHQRDEFAVGRLVVLGKDLVAVHLIDGVQPAEIGRASCRERVSSPV